MYEVKPTRICANGRLKFEPKTLQFSAHLPCLKSPSCAPFPITEPDNFSRIIALFFKTVSEYFFDSPFLA